ncbi:MAG: hypothetical protein J6W22_04720 [Fibrobacter sp.]|nr:hypothetical protein [Fibrobacter sp.]
MFIKKDLNMKKWILSALTLGSILVTACSDDKSVVGGTTDDAGITAVTDWEVAGVTQKGPFVTGSAVTVQELDGITLKQTGKSFKGSIKSDKGDFAIKDIDLKSQYAILEASGYYRDEITGKKSSGTVMLRALTDLSNRKTVNINLLTHLEYERAMYLVNEKKKSIADAKAQAEEEIFAVFGIEGDFGESEDLDIFKTGDGNAALLAVSVLMQSNVDVAGLTERMGKFSIALAEGGSWDDADTKASIADWACDVDLKGTLSNVRKNIEDWKYADTVPAFEKYVTNFWWENYGLGTCDKKRENEIKRNVNKLSTLYNTFFVCEDGRWLIPSDEKSSSSEKATSSSSKKGDPSSSALSSSAGSSSSSLYDPFVRSSSSEPLDTIPPLPSAVDFFDSTYSFMGYTTFGEGKQEVWHITAIKLDSDRDGRDSVASALVKEMERHGFAFEGAILNDSLSDVYDSVSYVYSKTVEDIVYKLSITKWYGAGMMYSSYYTFTVKLVVLKDGFKEVPTTDFSSLAYIREFPEELSFMREYFTTKSRSGYDDDSVMNMWVARHDIDSVRSTMGSFAASPIMEAQARDSMELFKTALLENEFDFVKSDSLGQNANTGDTHVPRYFYEKETSFAKYEVTVSAGVQQYYYFGVQYDYAYGYTMVIRVYYKTKPEYTRRSERE